MRSKLEVLAKCEASGQPEGFHVRVLILGSVAALLIASVTVTLFAGEASAGKKEINSDQARAIVLTFLKSQGYDTKSPKFYLENEADDPDFRGFFILTAYYDTPNLLSVVGHYAVDRATADLWDSDSCEQMKSKALEQFQNRLRREMALSKPEKGGPNVKPCF